MEWYDPDGNTCILLGEVFRPLGNSHIDQTWAQGPHAPMAINSQKDAHGNETTFAWAVEPNWWDTRVWMTNPEGDQSEYLHALRRYPLSKTDEEGNSTRCHTTKTGRWRR